MMEDKPATEKEERLKMQKCRLGQNNETENENEKRIYARNGKKKKNSPHNGIRIISTESDIRSSVRAWTMSVYKGIWESKKNADGPKPG